METLMGMMPRMRNMLKESDAQEVDNDDYDQSGHQRHHDDDDSRQPSKLTSSSAASPG